jgi:hypothetical protein
VLNACYQRISNPFFLILQSENHLKRNEKDLFADIYYYWSYFMSAKRQPSCGRGRKAAQEDSDC